MSPKALVGGATPQRKSPRENKKFVSKRFSSSRSPTHSPLAFHTYKNQASSRQDLYKSPAQTSSKKKLNSDALGNSLKKRTLRNSNSGTIMPLHRQNFSNTLVRNTSHRGVITMTDQHGAKNGLVRVKSGRRRSAMSDRSRDSLTGLVPETNQAPNQFYDKNLGKAYDRFK